eukprot:SM000182S03954  [mRNA]  locus=s182:279702:280360:- [translate_table: standard]
MAAPRRRRRRPSPAAAAVAVLALAASLSGAAAFTVRAHGLPWGLSSAWPGPALGCGPPALAAAALTVDGAGASRAACSEAQCSFSSDVVNNDCPYGVVLPAACCDDLDTAAGLGCFCDTNFVTDLDLVDLEDLYLDYCSLDPSKFQLPGSTYCNSLGASGSGPANGLAWAQCHHC